MNIFYVNVNKSVDVFAAGCAGWLSCHTPVSEIMRARRKAVAPVCGYGEISIGIGSPGFTDRCRPVPSGTDQASNSPSFWRKWSIDTVIARIESSISSRCS